MTRHLSLLFALLGVPALGAPQAAATEPSAVVYVARRGWHIDIGMATADLRPPLDALASQFPGAQYLFFGFGDRHYLLAKRHNAPVLLAALWPGNAVLLVTGLAATPQEAFGASHVIELATLSWSCAKAACGTLSAAAQVAHTVRTNDERGINISLRFDRLRGGRTRV